MSVYESSVVSPSFAVDQSPVKPFTVSIVPIDMDLEAEVESDSDSLLGIKRGSLPLNKITAMSREVELLNATHNVVNMDSSSLSEVTEQ